MLNIGLCGMLFGQPTALDYYGNATQEQEYVPEITPDLPLFYAPLEGGYDQFSKLSEYNFSVVRYQRRGYDRGSSKYYLHGIDLSNALDGGPNFNVLGALGRIPNVRGYTSGLGMASSAIGDLCGIYDILTGASLVPMGNLVSVSSSDRRYRLGVKASSVGVSTNGDWGYAIAASRRWGTDAHIKGVFTDETLVSGSIDYKINNKQSVSLFCIAPFSEQGLRSGSTKEAFMLTDNNLYNPSWGYYGDRVRNSKVRSGAQPLFLATYNGAISKRTNTTISISYMFGKSGYTALSWYDAPNPSPDYYKYLPSGNGNPVWADHIESQWREGISDVTQTSWSEMHYQNSVTQDGRSSYMLENRIEKIGNIQFVALFNTHFDDRVEINYGVRVRRDGSLFFKRADDLLGGDYVVDIDQHLIDDQYYSDKLQNDIRNPNRVIAKGDSFGYNYNMIHCSYKANAQIAYRADRYVLNAGIEVGGEYLLRRGNYEKELFAGDKSYGDSQKISYQTYAIKLSGAYYITSKQSVILSALISNKSPTYEDIYLSPNYNNLIIDHSSPYLVNSFESEYNITFGGIKLKAAAFATLQSGQSTIYRFYDDISSKFCDASITNIDKLFYGVELGAYVPLSPRLRLDIAASVASYTYNSNPTVDLYVDANAQKIVENQISYIKGFVCSATPQSVFSSELNYSGQKGWMGSLSVNYMADSYISLDPMRRMHRSTDVANSPEAFRSFVDQERFKDAVTIDLFLFKAFKIGNTSLNLILSINNLLDSRNIVYSGYEQMRIRKRGTGVGRSYEPFDSRYTYAYGRTYYLGVNYKF